jgi:predicted nucleotidyltransferase
MRNIHTLEELLAGTGRIAVLRALASASEPLTGRQVARVAGLSHAGATRVLSRLHDAGLVTRRSVGRAMLHQLVHDDPVVSRLVMPLFHAEQVLVGFDPSHVPMADAKRERVNPHVRPHVAAIEDACRRHHVTSSALFGSATQNRDDVVPNDLDVLVTFAPLEPRMKAEEYAALSAELEVIMGMPVDVMVSTAIRNPALAEEIERTKVVLYEAA